MRTDDALRHLRRCALSQRCNRVVKVRHSYRNSRNFSGRCGVGGDCRSNDAVNSPPGKSVYPVIAAVTGPILTFAPPAFFGTSPVNGTRRRSMGATGPDPLKIVFSPRRVIV